MPRNAIHPNDHRNHEEGGDQQQQALKAVFTDLPALQGHGYGQAERGSRSYAVPGKACEVCAPGTR